MEGPWPDCPPPPPTPGSASDSIPAPSSLFCALPAARHHSWLSDILLVIGTLLDAQYLAPRCPPTHLAYSSLPGILVITRPSLAFAPSWLLGAPLGLLGALSVTRRFPVHRSSPLACWYPQRPSWSLLALLAVRQHISGWHLVGTYLIVWDASGFRYNPGLWLWPLCVLMNVRRRTGHSVCLFALVRACLPLAPPPSIY